MNRILTMPPINQEENLMCDDDRQLQINIVSAETRILNFKPGDRLAVVMPDEWKPRGPDIKQIEHYFKEWSGVPVIVLFGGMNIEVLRPDSEAVDNTSLR